MSQETSQDEPNRIFTRAKNNPEIMKSEKTSTNEIENSPRKAVVKKEVNQHQLSSLGVPSNFKTKMKKYKSESLQTLSQKKRIKTIPVVKYNLDELQNKIKELNTQVFNENSISLNHYNSLNDEIKIKITVIKELANEQKDLISQLKTLKNDLNNKIEKVNIILLKKK